MCVYEGYNKARDCRQETLVKYEVYRYLSTNEWINAALFPGPEATALKRGRDNPGEILESPIQSSRTKIWAGKSGREKETKTRKQANFFSARYSA